LTENTDVTEISTVKEFWKEFEDEVKSFLIDKLKFEDIKGGPAFHIAPADEKNQIDVAARWKETLFVFQCKAAGRRTKKNLRETILALEKRARIISENYKTIPEYAKCQKLVFVLITKKIELAEPNLELLQQSNPKIYYADENLLEYYSDLYDKIGEYATYNFLSEFGVKPPENEKLHAVALKTRLGRYTVYSFYTRPKQLLKFAYVARRRSKQESFYQRMLEKSRIKNIQKFVDSGGIFPSNIIISLRAGEIGFSPFREGDETKNDVVVGLLTIKNSYDACWIVDGQHRLYAFSKSSSNYLVPCIAFDGISIPQERSFFLEINKEQKPIQADLIWDLEGEAHPDTIRGSISNIVKKLNWEEPFLGKIYVPISGPKKSQPINIAAFCNGIVNAKITSRISPNLRGRENPLFSEDHRKMVNKVAGTIQTYFSVLIEEPINQDHEEFIIGNAGTPILLYLLEPIVSRIGYRPSMSDFRRYCIPIKKFFREFYPSSESMRKLRNETTSEGNRKFIAREIGTYIRKENKDKEFWPAMEKSEILSEIILMERRIGKLISVKLSEITTNWAKQRIPDDISKYIIKKAEKDGTELDENFDLGEELKVILRRDNWEEVFKNIFITKEGFKDESELTLAFRYIKDIRDPQSHGKSVLPSREHIDMCNIYLTKFSRVVPEITNYLENESSQIPNEDN